MIKVSDYVVKRLVEHGVKDVFMITGGGAMHLNDSIGKCKDIKYICNHHEQASAIAAEGYSRVNGKLAVVQVTTGPGGTNTLTGVLGQWTDSIPVLYISGQVKFETTIESCPELELRQLGDQEVNIVDIVKPITKYAEMVTEAKNIKKIIDKAIHIATTGRPGPVWIDIPLNIQGALVDEKDLVEFEQEEEITFNKEIVEKQVKKVVQYLKEAKRPVFIAGHAIRLSNSKELFYSINERLGIPVVSTFNGYDLIATDNPLFVGRIGTVGNRPGNFALQNADLVICLGSRNNIRQVSYDWKKFGTRSKMIIIDIDEAELKKPTVSPDLSICSELNYFLNLLNNVVKNESFPSWSDWQNWCVERKNKYPVVLPEYRVKSEALNPYYFIDVLTQNLAKDTITVAGNGTACVTLFQAGIVKDGQRCFWNSGCASMGYDLPAAIGAAFAGGGKNVICLAGDGSLQMNIQELQTMVHHQLPLKLFVLNNSGYISIRQTQSSYFEGRLTGCGNNCGVSFPNIIKVAEAYGLPAVRLTGYNLEKEIKNVLNTKGPVVCEVCLEENYIFAPKLSSEKKEDGTMISKPLEDMYPFLDREEFKSNII